MEPVFWCIGPCKFIPFPTCKEKFLIFVLFPPNVFTIPSFVEASLSIIIVDPLNVKPFTPLISDTTGKDVFSSPNCPVIFKFNVVFSGIRTIP